jgi:membrane protease YdiL (CAAX protease family)
VPLPGPSEEELLGRSRGWQVASILMIVAGLLLPLWVILTNAGILSAEATPEQVQRLLGPLMLLALGGMLLIAGLLANAIRAVIVRRALTADRYRGPAMGVLLLLAVILATLLTLLAGDTAVALVEGGDLSPLGTLVLLTSTQLSLLLIAAAFVGAPRALAGVRLWAAEGVARSVLLGLALSVPAWLLATGLALLWSGFLDRLGLREAGNVTQAVLDRGNPAIVVLAFVLVAPVAEEIYFRGVVFNAWLRERGANVALYGSAALFAVIHGSVYALLPIFALGLTLAVVYRRTGSLPAAIALHAGFNAISVGLSFLAR